MASIKELSKTLKEKKQIFFDCDNTLVSTEDVATEAASAVVNKVLADQNIAIRYDNTELVGEFFGKTAREMVVLLQEMHNFTLSKEQIQEYTVFEEKVVIELLRANPSPCGGIKETLQQLSDMKKYKLAVVSSSPIGRIRAALEAADLAKFFEHDKVFSAKSSMPTPRSKPDPAIYQWAMDKNGVTADECIAFEDSRSGARPAINAGVACVAYVGAYATTGLQEEVASTLKKEGCLVVIKHYNELQGCIEEVARELKE